MMFTGLTVLVILAIVFFHYIQGFFSAALSAILVIVAAVLAFSYHESVVEMLMAGKLYDTANAIALLALFALIYLILRIIFDTAVPGNVRVPVAVDKAGAAVMGLTAGIFAAGIIAIAAQELPFGPSIIGFARFDTQGTRKNVKVDLQGRGIMSETWDELSGRNPGEFGEPDQQGHGVPILPVDDVVVGLVNKLSAPTGSLAAGKPLASIHPSFLDEMFGQRLGIETTGGHVTVNSDAQHIQDVKVLGLYQLDPKIKQADGEYDTVRFGGPLKPLVLKNNQMFLVVRTLMSPHAQDKDGMFRFSPGSCRLMVDRPEGATEEAGFTNLYPVGTLQGTDTLYLNKIDDFLLVDLHSGDKGVDLVYVVDKNNWKDAAPPGTFFEMKRLARVELSGEKVNPQITPDAQIDLMRKYYILHPEENPELPQTPRVPGRTSTPTPAPQPSQAPQDNRRQPRGQQAPPPPQQTSQGKTPSGPVFGLNSALATENLGFALATGGRVADGEMAKIGNGTISLQGGKLKTANFDITLHDVPRGGVVSQFVVPAGQKMIQIDGSPPASNPWIVATEPEQYELVDSQGKHYQPNGLFMQYGAGFENGHINLRYIDSATISGAAPPEKPGGLARLVIYYLVPSSATITEFDDHGQKAAAVNVATP